MANLLRTRDAARTRRLAFIVIVGLLGGIAVYASLTKKPAISPVLSASPISDADARTMLERLITAVRADPTSAEAHGRLGIGYLATELVGEARRCFENALALAPDSARWRFFDAIALMNSGRNADALPLLRTLAKEVPGSASVRHRLAVTLFESGDFAAAESEYRATTELAPQAPHGFVGLAKVANSRSEPEAALQHARRALSCDAGFAAAHNEIGAALRSLDRTAEAAAALTKGAGAGRTEAFLPDEYMAEIASMRVGRDATMDRAAGLMRAGRGAEAETILKALEEKFARDTTVLNNYGTVVQQNGDARKAKSIFLRGAEIDPTNVSLQISLASCLAQLGELEPALRHARQAVTLAPENADAHFTLGRVRRGRRELGLAVESFRAAVRLDGTHVWALRAFAEALIADKKLAEAIAPLTAVLRIEPKDVQSHITLAELYLETGQTAAAAAALAPAVHLAPRDPLVRQLAQRLGLGDG